MRIKTKCKLCKKSFYFYKTKTMGIFCSNKCFKYYQKYQRYLYYKILTKEFLEKEYIQNKNPAKKIAKNIGCSYQTIYDYLKKFNITIRNHSESKIKELNGMYGKKRTQKSIESTSKILKELWGNNEFKNKTLKAQRKGMKLNLNKKEEILKHLLYLLFFNKYKYTGNRNVWIEGFNPDFINEKDKKIIELFGDYWHNLPQVKERDVRRLETYKKYGYKTLIIWENELKDLELAKNRLLNFT
jgi:very-short-patch-repair endonuclease